MAFKSKITPNIADALAPISRLTPTITGFTDTLTIIGLSVANTSSSTITISARLIKNGGEFAYLIKNGVIEPGNTLVIVGGDQKLVLEANDFIDAYSSHSNAADAIISYLI